LKARVAIRLKPAILDPQGKTVQQALMQLGYNEVKSVRVGKLIELELDASDPVSARAKVEEFSRKLLANPLMETFEIELAGDARK
jgi:phosphoribosylformylglycinamidine synthase subunit PurS